MDTNAYNNIENITMNIIKQTIKEKIIELININIDDYNFKQDIMDEMNTCSNHIFKNVNIKQLEEEYRELCIEDLTTHFYEKCVGDLILHNSNETETENENENENETLYIIINNNIFNNNVQYGIISEYENTTINYYHTFSERELKKIQQEFNQNDFIILTDDTFIFVMNLDFIQEELLNSYNVYLK